MTFFKKYPYWALLTLILGVLFILLLLRQAVDKNEEGSMTAKTRASPSTPVSPEETSLSASFSPSDRNSHAFKTPEDALEGEMVVGLNTAEEMESFLKRAASVRADVLGVIPELHLIRVGFSNTDQGAALRQLAPESTEIDFNYKVFTPPPPPPNSRPTNKAGPAKPFYNQALEYLGVPKDNEDWGSGITIAILDTGVAAHFTFEATNLSEIDLLSARAADTPSLYPIDSFVAAQSESDALEAQEHGTAVASIISGRQGLAPSADILSVRVLDPYGVGDTFTIAAGIQKAIEEGAQIINLSFGSYRDNFVLRRAVKRALENDVAMVAAVGNDGLNELLFPANYEGVLAVSAVDAQDRHLSFSNTSPRVDIAAPGFEVLTAWGEEDWVNFSGTSAAAPFVTGALAGIRSTTPELTNQEAVNLLLQYTDDAGLPGQDPQFGHGILNIGRLENRDKRGIYDVAIADYYLDVSSVSSEAAALLISIQNRGTERLTGLKLKIQSEGATDIYPLPSLGVGETTSHKRFLSSIQLEKTDGIRIDAEVLNPRFEDINPHNNYKTIAISIEGILQSK